MLPKLPKLMLPLLVIAKLTLRLFAAVAVNVPPELIITPFKTGVLISKVTVVPLAMVADSFTSGTPLLQLTQVDGLLQLPDCVDVQLMIGLNAMIAAAHALNGVDVGVHEILGFVVVENVC